MLLMAEGRVTVEVDGRQLSLSNLDKQLYPAAGLPQSRRDRLLPADRPGDAPPPRRPPAHPRAARPTVRTVSGSSRSAARPTTPSWVRVSDPLEPNGGQRSCIVEDLPTLVWLANLAALELHTNQWKLPDVNRPCAVVLDLDPGAPADVLDCCRVAIELREMLDALGLVARGEDVGRQGPAHLGAAERRAGRPTTTPRHFALALGPVARRPATRSAPP